MTNAISLIFLSFLTFCNVNDLQESRKIENYSIDGLNASVSTNSVNKKPEVVEIGYPDTYEKLPKLKFTKISEAEFERNRSERFLITPKLEKRGNNFYIRTKNENYRFRQYRDYGGTQKWSGSEFLGYYTDLKLFALTNNSMTEGLQFGSLMLIDKDTDYKYKIISIGDGSVETPIPSKNDKYLVYYHNYVYKHKNSFIAVLKVNQKSSPKTYLQEYASFQSDDFAVEKIVWIDDRSFVVKGFEEIYKNQTWVKEYSYYQATFE